MPAEGLFAGHEWRVSPAPFKLDDKLAKDLDSLGRVLLQFIAPLIFSTAKALRANSPHGSRAGLSSASRLN